MDAQSEWASALWQSITCTHSQSDVINPISVGIIPVNALYERSREAAQTVKTIH
jgi:hypothetical protein